MLVIVIELRLSRQNPAAKFDISIQNIQIDKIFFVHWWESLHWTSGKIL